ncbi:LOW QUALITY PROTEIN: hypothetical protein SETIT_2G336800v2 [Setaria italica]|uniref:Fungal lipase-like domain-containing protein n=2 Tax=Setaria italica TaxID=4555 RepID=A0A368Q629_SETIT|nr:LOW QUALITY PROTEIN: hypothetical protein SETIT_2G336800v2 [Setaria italica]
MDSGDAFAESGPKLMMARAGVGSSPTMIETDWCSSEHRRCVATCVVKGTYGLESDREKGRLRNTRENKQAPGGSAGVVDELPLPPASNARCDCFSCDLFVGANRSFIYGAIYEYEPPGGAGRHPEAPHYIVAFRGTMLRDPAALHDIYLDGSIALNKQHRCRRFRRAREQVEQLLKKITNGASGGVWLAGHSLGASIALDEGCYLPTFLFNPPLLSLAPLAELLRMSDAARRDLCVAKCTVKAAFGSTFLRSHVRRMEGLFQRLEDWVPELFLHRRDIICQGFIDYLEQRQEILDRVPPEFRWLAEEAMELSLRDTLTSCWH